MGKLTSNLSAWAKALRDAGPLGLNFPKVPSLLVVRQRGNMCYGVHAVLAELSDSVLPKKVQKLEQHILDIEVRLKKKGIGHGPGMVALPTNFEKVMEATKAASRQAKTNAKATEGDSEEAKPSP